MKKVFITFLYACTFPVLVMAQNEKTAELQSTLILGISLTDGNSETFQANAAIVTEGEKAGFASVRAGVEGNYGESTIDNQKETTVENAHAFGNIKKTLTKRTFVSLDSSALYDDIAQIDYRVILSPCLGAYLVKNDQISLSVETGPSYVWERLDELNDDYLALRFGERFNYRISKTAKIWQSLDYLPRADDFNDYLLNAELGAEAVMNTFMSLRFVLQDKYDSSPGEESKKNDITLIAGISLLL